MNKSKPKLKGFTLLELIIVIAILVVMMAILVPSISDYIRTNHILSANNQAQQIYMAAQDYLVNEQIKGTTTKDMVDTPSSPPRLCWIMVTSEAIYDSSKTDNNRTVVVDSYGINTDINNGYVSRVMPDGRTSFPIADGIESRVEGSFSGAWVVAFYPKTFTVAYAVYNGYYKTEAERLKAVERIGTNGGVKNDTSCDDRLYLYEFTTGSGSTTTAQESDFMHPSAGISPHMYTGQFPVRDFTKDPI